MKLLKYQWDRALGWLAITTGALAILLGWLGVRATSYVFEQLPYVVSGAVGGLFLLGLGATLLLSADLRDEWRKLDAIAAALRPADHEPATRTIGRNGELLTNEGLQDPVDQEPAGARKGHTSA